MRNELTPEQSNRLIELGVDPSKASMCQIQHEADGETIYRIVEHDEFCYEMSGLRPKPLFTLSDILSLLPKDISTDNADYYLDICAVRYNGGWTATYLKCGSNGQSTYGEVASPELIDALYELLVWCITNKHLEL